MKKFVSAFAAVLAAASLMSVAGCAKSTASLKVATTANWNASTSAVVERNFTEFWQSNAEVAEYAVSFTEGTNSRYFVSYDTDKSIFSTRISMEKYDWSAAGIPEDYRAEANDFVYVYEENLALSGKYTIKSSGEEYAFDDVLTTVCKFRLAGDNLAPVYSKVTVKNSAPSSLGSNVLADVHIESDETEESFYSRDLSKVKISTDDRIDAKKSGEQELALKNKQKYSIFDSAQLRAAVRAFTMTEKSSRLFNVVSTKDKVMSSITAAVSAPAQLNKEDEKQKAIADAMSNCADKDYIFFDGTPSGDEEAKGLRYSSVTLSLNADMNGQSPVYWYSTVENNDLNGTRGVLLRMVTPLPFIMGTLDYTLKSVGLEKTK